MRCSGRSRRLAPHRPADADVRDRSSRALARRRAGHATRRRVHLESANYPAVARRSEPPGTDRQRRTDRDRAVRVRFKRAFAEQVYTFGFLTQPLPSHLLESSAPHAIAVSDFANHPVGNGPFRFERRVAGQLIELHADTTFFLGRPTIAGVIFRAVEYPTRDSPLS